MTATERCTLALALRSEGLTYKRISEHLGCGPRRAGQIIKEAKRLAQREQSNDPFKMLSVRAWNCLKNARQTPESLTNSTDRELLKLKNLGRKSLREVRKFFPYANVRKCPHCGGVL